MTYRGIVQGGVVVFQDAGVPPDGTEVTMVPVVVDDASSSSSAEPSIWQKLAALGRWAETQPCDLPSDLAANHDHYLHGLPKRQ